MPTPTNPTPEGEWLPFTTGGTPVDAEYRIEGRTVRWRFAGTDAEMLVPEWPIEPLGETTGNIRSTPDGRLIETRPATNPDLDPCTLAEGRAAIEEAINAVWMMSAEHLMSDADASRAEDRFVALAHLVEYLADLLDGVLADDPQAIRDAASWLTVNRPEVGS